MRPRGMAVAAAALAVLAALPACESRRDAERLAEAESARAKTAPRLGQGPQALMVRFEEWRGSALEREGWELEILQLGGDARLRGSVRTPTSVTPVTGVLAPEEFADLWSRLQALPLDGFRAEEDTTVADTGWMKRLEVDVVVGPERRIRSRNRWTHPLVGAPWVDEIEGTLHAYAVEHAAVADTGTAAPDSTREAVSRAVQDALKDVSVAPPRDGGASP